jgi:hypothetical protein
VLYRISVISKRHSFSFDFSELGSSAILYRDLGIVIVVAAAKISQQASKNFRQVWRPILQMN